MKTFDVGSVESSDTYASCCTHPFNSLADLTQDTTQDSQSHQPHNVYINPLEVMVQSSKELNLETVRVPIKKTISEDNSIINNKIVNLILPEEHFDSSESYSTTSTSSPLIKKPKFLQGLRTRFDDSNVSSNDFHETAKQVKQKITIKSSFFPYRGICLLTPH